MSHRKTLMAVPSKDETGRATSHSAEKPPFGGPSVRVGSGGVVGLGDLRGEVLAGSLGGVGRDAPGRVLRLGGAGEVRAEVGPEALRVDPDLLGEGLGRDVLDVGHGASLALTLPMRGVAVGERFVHTPTLIDGAPHVNTWNVMIVYGVCKGELFASATFDPATFAHATFASVVQPDTTPPATPPKDRSQDWQLTVRSEAPRPYFLPRIGATYVDSSKWAE